jgi:NADPH:quinone reductase-like Zn-dependent oxidoreductase
VAGGSVKPHVHKTYSLDAAGEALTAVEEGHAVGKIVLAIG